jgi:hypothetical protein
MRAGPTAFRHRYRQGFGVGDRCGEQNKRKETSFTIPSSNQSRLSMFLRECSAILCEPTAARASNVAVTARTPRLPRICHRCLGSSGNDHDLRSEDDSCDGKQATENQDRFFH